jgi:hypothetical protein
VSENARARLVAEVVPAAERIAEILDGNPVLGDVPYPMAEVHRQLSEQQEILQRAVWEYPLPLIIGQDGRPEQLGQTLAALVGYLEHALVLFHNLNSLDQLPERMRAQVHRQFSSLHLCARKVRATRQTVSSRARK